MLMEEKPNIQTEDENGLLEAELWKVKTTGLDLAMQIFPLLDDYFCGTFAKNTKGVLMKLENGQVFQLSVTEVA